MLTESIGVLRLVELMAESMATPCLLLDYADDRESQILYVNPAFTRMTGYTRGELQGAEVSRLSGEASEVSVMHRVRSAMRSFRPVRGVKTNARKSGETYMCELVVRPLHDDAGHVGHYIVFEREVRRRRGRPPQTGQHFEPVCGEESENRLFALD